MDIRIAARKSDLARLQAYLVGDILGSMGFGVQYNFRQSLGDINQEDPLWKMPEKGVFTEDFREGLLKEQWDLVVHSWKDLPVEIGRGTELVATLPREDVRDLFLLKKNSLQSVKESKKLKVFSSSPRRIYNLTPFFKDYFPGGLNRVDFESVRGNILTRVRKMIENPNVDGLIVAKAAIDRLFGATRDEFLGGQRELRKYFDQCLWQVLPLRANPTAAAQGALAVEIAQGRPDLQKIFSKINCQKTWDCVQKERQILKSYGGGCHQKIGINVLSRSYGELKFLKGESEQGEVLSAEDLEGFKLKLTNPCAENPSFFERKELSYQRDAQWKAHFVARANALPESETMGPDEILWASGLSTWRTLAERGLWVSGCSESLGEDEDRRLEDLAGDQLSWVKWTHNQSSSGDKMNQLLTYELSPKEVPSGWDHFAEYFWMSGTQFLRAIELSPKILDARHFCGPGNTFTMISKVLKDKGISNQPQRLPSRQIWRDAVKESKK